VNISEFNHWLASKEKEPLIMGILNVTPDSFSDGGLYYDTQKAIDHALLMIEEGADIIDIGGESTRPFSDPVSVKDELSRVLPVIEKLRNKTDIVTLIREGQGYQVVAFSKKVLSDINKDSSGKLICSCPERKPCRHLMAVEVAVQNKVFIPGLIDVLYKMEDMEDPM